MINRPTSRIDYTLTNNLEDYIDPLAYKSDVTITDKDIEALFDDKWLGDNLRQYYEKELNK